MFTKWKSVGEIAETLQPRRESSRHRLQSFQRVDN
jgi:hypothetical protein